MHIRFIEGKTRRWALTEGLVALGQMEIALPLGWAAHDFMDGAGRVVLEMIGDYIATQPKRILAGQTMRYGWSTLRFRPNGTQDRLKSAHLVIQELLDSLDDGEPEYIDGATTAIRMKLLQMATAQRVGIDETDHPHRSQGALICRRVMDQGGDMDLFMQRMQPLNDKPESVRDSRWYVCCMQDDHDHQDVEQMAFTHLSHLVEHHPVIFPYLGLPEETNITIEADTIQVFPPGSDDPIKDEAERFKGMENFN